MFLYRTRMRNIPTFMCVKAKRFDGTRLNPRKADLQRDGGIFADRLRGQRIEANATRRPTRFVTKSTQSNRYYAEKSGRKTNALNTPAALYVELKRARHSELP